MYPLSTQLKHYAATSRAILWMWRNHPYPVFRQLLDEHLDALHRACAAAPAHNMIDRQGILARKTSDRVFVFGSGYSLNDIPDAEWAKFGGHDTLGFSGSIYMKKLPLTYLLLRAWTETSAGSLAWRNDANDVLGVIDANPYLKDTVFAFPEGFTAIFSNRLLGYDLWRREQPTFWYLADKVSQYPHRKLEQGLVHGMSTLCSALSLAVALGYNDIVLVGVDLYDSRYFWLAPDKTLGWSEEEQKLVASDTTVRGAAVVSQHNTVNNGIVDYLGGWNRHLEKHYGARMSVYNPRSLLARTIPVFKWD